MHTLGADDQARRLLGWGVDALITIGVCVVGKDAGGRNSFVSTTLGMTMKRSWREGGRYRQTAWA
jgi:hypothetical protein